MGTAEHFDDALKQYHLALDVFVRGDSGPLKALFSRGDDVTLGNPYGPFVRGFSDAEQRMDRAASNYRDGAATGFDNLAKSVTGDLAHVVETEHFTAKVAGRNDIVPITLRVTSIFRAEDGVWRVAHRHADPIATDQPPESVIRQ